MSWQNSPEEAGVVGVRREEAALCFLAQCQGANIRWAGEEGREEGGKVQDVLSPTSCRVEEPGKAALHTRLPELALKALKEHHFPVL